HGILPAVRAGEFSLSHHHGAQSVAAGECDEVSAVRLAHSGSQSRAYFAAGSQRAHGASARPSEVDDGAARCFRRGGSAARHGRDLRRGRLYSRAADRRDRSADGARRTNAGYFAAHREPGNEARSLWMVVGVGAALALGRLIASQLYETSANNPLLLSATIAVLGIAALLACLFPARRASLLNPVEALRVE